MGELYDSIGRGYRAYRRPDPRIAAAIERALGDASSVLKTLLAQVGIDPGVTDLIWLPGVPGSE